MVIYKAERVVNPESFGGRQASVSPGPGKEHKIVLGRSLFGFCGNAMGASGIGPKYRELTRPGKRTWLGFVLGRNRHWAFRREKE
jgi:hypothetical protein